MALPKDELKVKRESSLTNIQKHWSVENGVLINDGADVYLITDKNYSDFIWNTKRCQKRTAESTCTLLHRSRYGITRKKKKFRIGADKGSGTLWNNKKNPITAKFG